MLSGKTEKCDVYLPSCSSEVEGRQGEGGLARKRASSRVKPRWRTKLACIANRLGAQLMIFVHHYHLCYLLFCGNSKMYTCGLYTCQHTCAGRSVPLDQADHQLVCSSLSPALLSFCLPETFHSGQRGTCFFAVLVVGDQVVGSLVVVSVAVVVSGAQAYHDSHTQRILVVWGLWHCRRALGLQSLKPPPSVAPFLHRVPLPHKERRKQRRR